MYIYNRQGKNPHKAQGLKAWQPAGAAGHTILIATRREGRRANWRAWGVEEAMGREASPAGNSLVCKVPLETPTLASFLPAFSKQKHKTKLFIHERKLWSAATFYSFFSLFFFEHSFFHTKAEINKQIEKMLGLGLSSHHSPPSFLPSSLASLTNLPLITPSFVFC